MKPNENIMQESKQIEHIFKNAFENFEVDVNPQAWSNIQNKMNYGGASAYSSPGNMTGLFQSLGVIGKIVVTASIVATVSGAIWFFSKSDDKQSIPVQNEQTKTVQTIKTTDIYSSENNTDKNPVASNNTYPKIISPKEKNLLIQNQNTDAAGKQSSATENSNSPVENNSASNVPQHKYGKSTLGNKTSLIRENQISKSENKENSSNENSSNQETAPIAFISTDILSGDAPLTVNFSNMGTAVSLKWDFDDGSSSNEISPSHTFSKPGTYKVLLAVTNSVGYKASDSVSILVKVSSGIINVPNVFTPNGDALNDIFQIELKNISSVVMTITDRFGNEIYKWNTLEGNWNGKKANGTDALAGTYYYNLIAVGIDGNTYNKKGFVELIR
ncbi:MAG: gliding motility-associated C-terminal domain-containing protein [Bacteroidota bacterium]